MFYPHFHQLTLRFAFPKGKIRAYHVLLKQPGGLGSAYLPVVYYLCIPRLEGNNLTTYHFGLSLSASLAYHA